MMNKRQLKKVAAIIAIILVIAMVLPFILSHLK